MTSNTLPLPAHAPPFEDALFASASDPFRRAHVTTAADYERMLAFWVQTYGIDEHWVRCDEALAEPPHAIDLHSYHLDGQLVGTVAFRNATIPGELFGHRLPDDFPLDPADVVEISKLCIAPAHREGRLMRRVCEDVHARLVLARRTTLAIAAPPWLVRQYAFIGFSPTGVRFPIPGLPGDHLEIMLSRQMRFGVYGLHTDPIRWHLFLASITERLLAAGVIHHSRWQRALVDSYRAFSPLAHQLERFMFRWRDYDGPTCPAVVSALDHLPQRHRRRS